MSTINIEEIFEIITFIAKGTYGKVFHVRKNGKEYALKMCSISGNSAIEPGILHETSVLQNINDDLFINIYEVFHGLYNNTMYICILLDYFGESLLIKKHNNVKILYDQIILAIKKLHKQGFYHGDLSGSNILVKDNNIKIIDFNLSNRIYRNKIELSLPPTVTVRPIEFFKTQKNIPAYDIRTVDSWSIGCLLYYLLTDKQLIKINDNVELYNIVYNDLKMILNRDLREKTIDIENESILQMLLNLNHEERILPENIKTIEIKYQLYKQKDLYNKNKILSTQNVKNILSRLMKYELNMPDELLFLTIVNIKRLDSNKAKINKDNLFMYSLMTYLITMKIISIDCYEINNIAELSEFIYWSNDEIVKWQIDICSNLEWNIDCTTAYNYIWYFDHRYDNYFKILIIIMNIHLEFDQYTEYCKAKAAYLLIKNDFDINIGFFENNNDDKVIECEKLLKENLIIDNILIHIINTYKMFNVTSWIKKNEK